MVDPKVVIRLLEGRDKAVLVYCSQKDSIDMEYLTEEAEEKGAEDYLEKVKAYCQPSPSPLYLQGDGQGPCYYF